MKSYAYLNDKISKKANHITDNEEHFKFDNTRHNGIWYSAVTVVIEDETSPTPAYYVEGLDFIEIKEIVKKAE